MVVGVDLTGALGCDYDGCVVRVRVIEKLVDSGVDDHVGTSLVEVVENQFFKL